MTMADTIYAHAGNTAMPRPERLVKLPLESSRHRYGVVSVEQGADHASVIAAPQYMPVKGKDEARLVVMTSRIFN